MTAALGESHVLGVWLFLRLLGLVWIAAFVSLGIQIRGLVGRRGILPAVESLARRRSPRGLAHLASFPTFSWWAPGDRALVSQCVLGAVCGALAAAGVAAPAALFVCWALYLSLFTVCRTFLGYQWDVLLLETGFLAVFLAPLAWLSGWPPGDVPPAPAYLLLLWLLFRLMFSSGYVKLRSGDPLWRSLTALTVHYETQPLPGPWSPAAHRLPRAVHRASAAAMLAVELCVPFLFFAPYPFRDTAAAATILLMTAILLTGNYGFFNVLTIALCAPAFDDRLLRPLFGAAAEGARRPPGMPAAVLIPVTALVGLVSAAALLRTLRLDLRLPVPLVRVLGALDPFRIAGSYGLFAVMTRSRPEIVVEGSRDGETWTAYEFRWKPGDPFRRPRFCAPHMPRLDWQMWFAALGPWQASPWFPRFLERLLEGEPAVLRLLARNPFPGAPPRRVRATLWDYRFADRETTRRTGEWWVRERLGPFCPVFTRGEQDPD